MKSACLRCLYFLPLLFIFSFAPAQTKKISGKVISGEDNQPLVGVSITIKGKSLGAQTNENGEYSIDASESDVLVFSYTGFTPQEVSVGTSSEFSITLQPDQAKLGEVVVIGYGTQSRRKVTGSVASVDKKVLQSVPRTNLATALQGTAPGLRVQQSSGQPGSTPNIVLRGGTNFDGSGSPLFVVDGVIVPTLFGLNYDDVETIDVLKDAASLAIYGARAGNGVILITTKKGKKGKTQVSYSFRRATNYVRRNDVPFMSAEDYIRWNRIGLANRYQLGKLAGDADTTATKGQITGAWGFGMNSGWRSPDGKYSTQLLNNANRSLLNDPKWHLLVDRNPFNPALTDSILFLSVSQRELEDMILQQSNLQEHYVNFSGANDQGAFALGIGTIKDVGMVIGSSLKRLNMNFNGGLNVNRNLKITTNISAYSHKGTPSYLTADNNGGLTGGLIQRFGGIAPTVRLNHDVTGDILPGVDGSTLGNPMYLKDKFINKSQEQRFAGSLNLEYSIFKDLKLLASGSGFMRYTTDESFNKLYQSGTGGAMISTRATSINNNRTFQYSYNGFLQYSKTISRHSFDIMGGGEFFDRKNYAEGASVTGAPTDFIPYLISGTTASGVPFSTFNSWNRFASVIARANYSYDNRFLLTVNTRYDGTSQLTDHYGFFPGISAGWNLHHENFFANSSFGNIISTLKPRISWGQNGTLGPLGDFSTVPQYNSAGVYNGYGGFVAGNLANADLKWERTTTLNMGVDLGFFKDRFSIIADYFIRDVFDKIQSPSVPAWTGYGSYTLNLARLQNKGVELEAKAAVIRPKNQNGFHLDLSANFFHVKSFVKELLPNGLERNRQGAIQVYDPEAKSYVWVAGLQEGMRVGSDEIWAPIYDGIYRNQEELNAKTNLYTTFLPYSNKRVKQLGDARWRDVDGNDTIDTRDYVFVGRTTPTAQGGFSVFTGWKGLSLFTQFDYSLGFMIANQSWLRGMSQVQGSQNGPVDVKNTWTPDNPGAAYPRYYWANYGRNYFTDAGGNTTAPANYWQKGDYLMLREITLSYEMPASLLSNVLKNRINGIKVYVSGSNLIYFTKYNGTFPEVGGNDVGRFPLPRTVTFGVNVNL
jgi:TonB-linked SusC/RagA family outer membrane protein